MAKRKKIGMLDGLNSTAKAVGLMAKGVGAYYKETPQVVGRVSRALAKTTKGGKGKIAKRSSYKDDMKNGIKQKSRQERGRIVYALAKSTKGGKGKISERPAHKRHVPKR